MYFNLKCKEIMAFYFKIDEWILTVKYEYDIIKYIRGEGHD